MPDSGGSIDVGACHICEDKATGKHYGAISCDGCKGFFRRSIRKSHNYVCRFDHRCQVDKNHRNGCRACRLQKCIIAGMKSAAIQNERDLIGKRKKPCSSSGEEEFLELLLRSEKMCQQLRSSVIKSTEQASYDCGKVTNAWSATDERQRRATINDVGKSIHQQLVLLVEWAKSLPHFNQLDVVDKACLLKHNAAQVIVLGVAFRSLAADDAICLANDALLPREHANQVGDINGAVNRILDELVSPMRRLAVDFCECVALKATLFFNPVARGVSDVDRVEEARACCLRALERRCMGRGDCRFGRLLLLLPPLHAVAQQLVEDVQLARVFGLANVDSLMQELILHDDSSDPQLINTLAATIKQE